MGLETVDFEIPPTSPSKTHRTTHITDYLAPSPVPTPSTGTTPSSTATCTASDTDLMPPPNTGSLLFLYSRKNAPVAVVQSKFSKSINQASISSLSGKEQVLVRILREISLKIRKELDLVKEVVPKKVPAFNLVKEEEEEEEVLEILTPVPKELPKEDIPTEVPTPSPSKISKYFFILIIFSLF